MSGSIPDPIAKWWSPELPYYVQEFRLIINSRSCKHSEMINTIWAHVLPSSVCTICITCLCPNRECLRDWIPWRRHCRCCCSELLYFAHGKHQCPETTRLEKMLLCMIIHLVRSTQNVSRLQFPLVPQQTNRQLEAICKQKILNAVEKSRMNRKSDELMAHCLENAKSV